MGRCRTQEYMSWGLLQSYRGEQCWRCLTIKPAVIACQLYSCKNSVSVIDFSTHTHLMIYMMLDVPFSVLLIFRYQVMSSCWMLEADMRPIFSGLVSTINSLLENTSGYLELLHIPSFEPSPLIGKQLSS